MSDSNNIFLPSMIHNTSAGAEQINLSSELFKLRKVFLIGEINEISMGILMQSLMLLDSMSDEPVELYINSPGGQPSSALPVYLYMTKMMRASVHTFCIGIAAVSAVILYLAGKTRSMYEGTKIMLHAPSSESCGSTDNIDMICSIISDRTGHPIPEICEIIKNENTYGADESLKLGFSTVVIGRETVNVHTNPFVSRPDESYGGKRRTPPPIERYHTVPDVISNADNVIIPAVHKSLLHPKRKDNTTMFRFGFSYKFNDDGRTVYANTDIAPSQTQFVNYRYNIDLGAADRQYECDLSDGTGTVLLTASEIAALYKNNRDKYIANRLKRSVLGT